MLAAGKQAGKRIGKILVSTVSILLHCCAQRDSRKNRDATLDFKRHKKFPGLWQDVPTDEGSKHYSTFFGFDFKIFLINKDVNWSPFLRPTDAFPSSLSLFRMQSKAFKFQQTISLILAFNTMHGHSNQVI